MGATSGCDKSTPGSCKVFGCKSSRGPTDCVQGQCVCKSDGCSVDGVCYSKCEIATGGSCKVLSCASSRNAECQSGDCVCGSGTCAFDGACKNVISTTQYMFFAFGNAT